MNRVLGHLRKNLSRIASKHPLKAARGEPSAEVDFGRKERNLESIIAISDMNIDGVETEYRQEVSESARETVSGNC